MARRPTLSLTEVAVGDEVFEVGDAEEVAAEGDFGAGGVSFGLGGGDGVELGGEVVLAEDGESGAGAADGDAGAHALLDGAGEGGVFPEADVVPLVAAGEEDGFGVADLFEHEGMAGGCAGADDEGGGGVGGALFEHEGVVGIGAGGAEDEEVAAAAAIDHPGEGGGDIAAAAHEDGAAGGGGGDVVGGAWRGRRSRGLARGGRGREERRRGVFSCEVPGVDWLRWRVRPASQVRVTAPAMA
jgi:hypothetical protein